MLFNTGSGISLIDVHLWSTVQNFFVDVLFNFDSDKTTYLGKEYGIPSRAFGNCRQDFGTEMSCRRLSSSRNKLVQR